MMMMMVMMMISMEFHYLLFSHKAFFFTMYLHSFKVMNKAHAVVDKKSRKYDDITLQLIWNLAQLIMIKLNI